MPNFLSKNHKSTAKHHLSILSNDVRIWLSQRVLAVKITLVFLLINLLHWIFRTVMHIYTYGTNATLAQFFSYHKPKIGSPFLFGHRNVPQLLLKLFHSLFFVNSFPSLAVNAILSLVLIGLAETRIGKMRLLFVSVSSTLIGTLLGLTLIGNLSAIIRNMHWITKIPIRLSPFTLFVGAFMASATYETILWRRRMLVLGYSITSAMLLYSGNPGDYCTIFAAICGHIIGNAMNKNNKTNTAKSASWWHGTDYEIRRLFSIAQLIMALGPVLALSSRSHAGILTTLGLFMSPQMGTKPWLARCISNYSSSSCLLHSGLQHATIGGLWIRILLPIVTLMIISWGLLRGRRLAAYAAITINGLTAVYATMYFAILPLIAAKQAMIFHKNNATSIAFMLTALPPLLIAILLFINIKHFPNHSDKFERRIGLVAIVLALFSTGIGYVCFGLIAPNEFKPAADLHHLLRDLPGRWMPMGFGTRSNAMLMPLTPLASAITQCVGVLLWIVLFVVCLMWFKNKVTINEEDRKKASQLVHFGGDTMSFMTTWPDNHYWFSNTERSAIAYRLKYGIALTLTGPFGDKTEYKNDLKAFIQLCEQNSWSPAFYAVHEEDRKNLESLGFMSIKVGSDMLVYPKEWQTRGKKWQDIRTAINKAKRDGITDVLSTYNDAPWEIQQQIIEISEEWAELKSLPEMKFTLGGLEELHDPRVKILYAIDNNGKVLGVTSWMPTYSNNRVIGWTLDFMRHRTDSPNGIMELLIARMAERLRDEGLENPESAVEFMSLSAAPLAGITDICDSNDSSTSTSSQNEANTVSNNDDIENNDNDGVEHAQNSVNHHESNEIIVHALEMMSDILEPAYGFKSLYFFKKKFQPTNSPVYICYLDSAKLAQISLAVTSSYLPETNPKQILEMLKTLKKDANQKNLR